MDDDANDLVDSVASGPDPSGGTSTVKPDPVRTPVDLSNRRSVLMWMGTASGVLLVAAIVGGIFVKLPYVALVPGSARDTEPLLEVEGIDAYPSDGELLYLTVLLKQQPNIWEYMWLQFDDDAEVLPQEAILQDRTPEENKEFNLELMNDSKAVAVAVALEELGYDAVQTDAVVVQKLVPDSPAVDVLVPGDSIVAIDDQSVTSSQELVEVLGDYRPGDEVELEIERFGHDGADIVAFTLGEHPDIVGGAFLGIRPADRLTFNESFDFKVEIDSGQVGGPSAGLAFSLAVLDDLTEGELTGGKTVAVTGTINAAGQVGPVGGVVQKTATVRDMGVEYFLVPSNQTDAELAQVRERAGDDLTIIPVSTIDEALDALKDLGGNVEAVSEYAATNQSSS